MKKLCAIIAALLLTANMYAQMSYQAVIRDAGNKLVVNKPIGMRVSIIVHWGPTPHVLYEETYSPNPQTNANGLVSIAIGSGIPVTGTFSGINWTLGSYSIQTETDPTGGTNYTITGTSSLLSVPFAIRAQTADSVKYSNIIGIPQPSHGSQYFISNGTFTVPLGITTIWVTASGGGGGGGGGGGAMDQNNDGGMGGSGMCVIGYQLTVIPGNTYQIMVGGAGTGGAGGGLGVLGKAGVAGGNSSFGSLLTVAGGGGGGGSDISGTAAIGSGYAASLFTHGTGGTGGAGPSGSNGGIGIAGATGTSGFVLVAY